MADAGCVYEPADKRGICHMLDTLAFSGSEQYPAGSLSGLMQKHGISAQASSSRDVMMAKVEAFRGSIPLAVSMLADTVLRPTLKPEEMEWARTTMGFQHEAFMADPSQVISEAVFEAAYGEGTAMGGSQFATQEQAGALTEQDLREYVTRMIRPERAVLSGAGVDHDELVAIAEKELGHLKPFSGGPDDADAPYIMPDTTYVGGVTARDLPLAEGMPGPLMTHASVVFPTMGWRDKREARRARPAVGTPRGTAREPAERRPDSRYAPPPSPAAPAHPTPQASSQCACWTPSSAAAHPSAPAGPARACTRGSTARC